VIGKIVNASRNSTHYPLAGSGVSGFKIIGDSPDAKECHLRLNRAPKRSEVIEHRAGRYIADRVRLENIATVWATQSLHRQGAEEMTFE
jgi:hypothetical protein